MLSMINENWLRLDQLCWVFECGRRLCPCALEKVLDCFQLLFALTQLLNFFNLHFFFPCYFFLQEISCKHLSIQEDGIQHF
jgi:hypothetical protein